MGPRERRRDRTMYYSRDRFPLSTVTERDVFQRAAEVIEEEEARAPGPGGGPSSQMRAYRWAVNLHSSCLVGVKPAGVDTYGVIGVSGRLPLWVA
jgi:hypothetical protein